MMSKSEIPSKPLSVLPLITQIDEILEKNGQVSQYVKDNLMFSLIKTMLIQQDEIANSVVRLANEKSILAETVEELQKRNIVTWCLNHPALSSLLSVLILFLLFSHYGASILNFFNIVIP